MRNKGDSFKLYINYTIDDVPLPECNLEDLEVQFNEHDTKNALNFKLSDGSILLDEEIGVYYIHMKQEDTFKLPLISKYQLRIYIDGDVISNDVSMFRLGDVLSDEVLGDEEVRN